ncbi:WhiB family transcriptional regulator [Nocardia sp. NPDC050408]|uniref:WhiB family transcriptional regulator n=1 Tax=Nocardia sp. NPDC050408 TaxID=3364319 RepID=UPI00379A0555
MTMTIAFAGTPTIDDAPGIDWREQAACRNHPEPNLWFPVGINDPCDDAKDICVNHCPVRETCGLVANRTRERHAVMAGFRCSDPDEFIDLRIWLGVENPARRTRTCRHCGVKFSTRHPRRRACPECRDLVPLEPVHRHIQHLRNVGKYTLRGIAAASGVSVGTVSLLAKGQSPYEGPYVSRAIAARLFAVTTEQEAKTA